MYTFTLSDYSLSIPGKHIVKKKLMDYFALLKLQNAQKRTNPYKQHHLLYSKHFSRTEKLILMFKTQPCCSLNTVFPEFQISPTFENIQCLRIHQ